MDTTKHTQVVGTVALYDDVDRLMAGARAVRDAGYRSWDCHTPYPVHGLDEAMGLKPSIVPTITLTAGLLGFLSAIALQGGLSVFQYPTNVGGKPLFSWPAFVPIMFELFVLFAALATMASIVILGRLGRWHHPLHDTGVAEQVSADRFAIVLSSKDARWSAGAADRLLHATGAAEVRPLVEVVEASPSADAHHPEAA